MVSKVMEVGENPLLSRGAIDSAEDESVSNTDLQQALEDSQKLNFEAQARAQSLEVDLISAKEALEGQKAKADAIANFGEVCSQKIKELENSISQLERCHHAVTKLTITPAAESSLPSISMYEVQVSELREEIRTLKLEKESSNNQIIELRNRFKDSVDENLEEKIRLDASVLMSEREANKEAFELREKLAESMEREAEMQRKVPTCFQ